MKIYEEKPLRQFEFWSGAADRVEYLTNDDFDVIESELEALYPDGMEDSQINDLFWFEFDFIAQMLGYEDEEDFNRKRDPKYIDDDDLVDYASDWFQEFVRNLKAEKNNDLAMDIAVNLFGFDEPDDEKGYDETGCPTEEYFEGAFNFLEGQIDNQEVFDAIFEDSKGEYETDGAIPSLEGFRDEIMSNNSKNQQK